MTPGGETLTLRVASLVPDVDAEAFVEVLRETLVALAEVNKATSQFGATNLQWRIASAGKSSPLFATLRPFGVGSANDQTGSLVIRTFVGGLKHLSRRATVPPHFTKAALDAVVKMANVTALGVSMIDFESNGTTVHAIGGRVASNASVAIQLLEHELAKKSGTYVEYGAIEGYLKDVSEQPGRDKIVITDALTGRKTSCYFTKPEIENAVRTAWKHRVTVVGEITVDRYTGEPKEMRVDELRMLRPRNELPQFEDLRGIDIAGGVESSEYVRGLRDEE